MKKILAYVLLFALIFACGTCFSEDETPVLVERDGIIYRKGTYFDCNTRSLSVYLRDIEAWYVHGLTDRAKELEEITVPGEIDGIVVLGIETDGIRSGKLKKLTLPGTIDIFMRQSMECPKLESINLDTRAETPVAGMYPHVTLFPSVFGGEGAYKGCPKLKTFTSDGKNLVDKAWLLGDNAFEGTAVEEIILDRDLAGTLSRKLNTATLECEVFAGCQNLRAVYMTENCTFLNNGGFKNCGSLDCLYFPQSIKAIRNGVFKNCKNVRSAVFPAADVVLELDPFADCPRLTVFGRSGTTVEDYAREADIPFIGSVINNGEPSTVVAQAYQTATVYINGTAVPAYTLNGSVYIKERNLSALGFGLSWDGEARTTTITKLENVQFSVGLNTNPEPNIVDIVSSDIKFMLDGFPIPALNIGNGESIIDVNALAGAVLY